MAGSADGWRRDGCMYASKKVRVSNNAQARLWSQIWGHGSLFLATGEWGEIRC
jgi:hypothetical protein